MRGRDQEQSQLFSYVSLEERVPRRHSLRLMRKFTDEILAELSEQFEAIYSDVGRPSIPPEQLLRALLLQVLYSIRSERLLMEQLDYNLLFRWFVGLELDDRVWVATVFTKNRDRLLKGEIAEAFLQGVVRQARRKRLLSDEHSTVDGTLLEAWASQKSFQPKDGPPSSGADFHREKRSNKTHASRTDPDARLAKKGPGKEAKLSYQASVLMDNRHGFLVATDVAEATGTAERDSALAMLDRLPTRKRRRTLGADKLYDTKDFVRELRERNFTPHVAQNVSNRRSAIDGRTTRHSGYEQSQRRRPMVEQGFGWDKTVGGLRKLRHRGTERVGWVFTFTVAVYDLVRLENPGSWPECLHERLRGREVPTLGHESAIRTAGKVLPHVGSPSPTAGTHSRYYFFSSLLGLEGARPFVVVVTLLGLPLALVLAWAYDVTPQGVKLDIGRGTDGETAASETTGTRPADPEEPDFDKNMDRSIAVLPFDNMSGDPEQEYFSDGISEDLTTALSRFGWLFVVARNSAFTYKGRAVDLKRVGRELGVRYVLEGSVRRAGSRMRVNVQLVDAETDRHVWAEQFDGETEEAFGIQDDIVARIAGTLGPEITTAEIQRARGKRPEIFNAWDHYLQAVAAYHRMTKEDLDAAISHLETALEIEPEFANAHALLGICHAHIGVHGWVQPVSNAYEEARRLADRAVRLAPASPEANHALAFVLTTTGEAEQAVLVARRAVELNPNFAEGYAVLGQALLFCGELEAALEACRQAERSSPRDPRGSWLLDVMGHAYFFLGDYERAIEVSRKALHNDPAIVGAFVTLACANAQLGREEEARRWVDELLELIPRYSLRAVRKNPMFVDADLADRMIESMKLAGLPE